VFDINVGQRNKEQSKSTSGGRYVVNSAPHVIIFRRSPTRLTLPMKVGKLHPMTSSQGPLYLTSVRDSGVFSIKTTDPLTWNFIKKPENVQLTGAAFFQANSNLFLDELLSTPYWERALVVSIEHNKESSPVVCVRAEKKYLCGVRTMRCLNKKGNRVGL